MLASNDLFFCFSLVVGADKIYKQPPCQLENRLKTPWKIRKIGLNLTFFVRQVDIFCQVD